MKKINPSQGTQQEAICSMMLTRAEGNRYQLGSGRARLGLVISVSDQI
jgi:hypothetical protein